MKGTIKFAIVAISLSVFGLTGCECKTPAAESDSKATHQITPKKGAYCTVQFRRDALGASSPLPVPVTTDGINGARVSLNGKFSQMDDSWVVLTAPGEKGEIWIPRSMILLIRVN
jgi:hypothetical protein